jgi:hypothetical protein
MEDLEKYDHNRKAVSNIIDLMLNDDYSLDLLLNYHRLLYVTDGSYGKNICHIDLLQYKIDLSDCLDIENLERMKDVSIIAVHGEVINEELTRKVLISLGECVQALKNYKPSINLDDFIMCSMRGLSEQILEDVIKQEEKREKA